MNINNNDIQIKGLDFWFDIPESLTFEVPARLNMFKQ
jgi:hypothetical protein